MMLPGLDDVTGPAARRPGLVSTAVGSVAAKLDQFDRVFLLGLVLLFAGLWRWWSLGVALTVAGGLIIALGLLAAARTPATVEPAEQARGGREGRSPHDRDH